MDDNDKQAVVPFSPQESSPELEEQVLEEITGSGFRDRLRSCCLPPKPSFLMDFGNKRKKGDWVRASQPATYSEYAGTATPRGASPPRTFSIDLTKEATLSPLNVNVK